MYGGGLFPPNKHLSFFTTFRFFVGIFIFCKAIGARALSLTTGLLLRIQLSLPGPDFSFWLGIKTLLQAAAGRGGLKTSVFGLCGAESTAF